MGILRNWKKEPLGSTVKDWIVGGIVAVALVRLVIDLAQSGFHWKAHQVVLVCVVVAGGVAVALLHAKNNRD